MLPRKYVSLLPASGPRIDADQSSSSGNTQDEANKRKRIGTQIACNSCRVKKTRCDGRRPTCGPCRKRTTDCIYSTRKDLGEEPQEILELLKWLPEHRAFDVLRVLRANDGDCAATLSVIKSGPGGTRRPSDFNVPPRRDTSTVSPGGRVDGTPSDSIPNATADFRQRSAREQSASLSECHSPY
ncbi:hypothetical protein PG995_007073 [Apiospora arundinis]